MNKEINKVFASDEYDKFSFMPENRDINRSKVEELKESMALHPLEKPIDVNELLQIIDGQHRYSAWRDLKMPIIYIVHKGWGRDQIPVLNTHQKNWNPSDFVKMYVSMGMRDYELYEEFVERWGFTHQANLFLLAGDKRGKSNSASQLFNEGNFKVTKWAAANIIAKEVTDLKEFYDGYKRRSFIAAYAQIHKHKNFKQEQLIDKLGYQSRKLVHCTTSEQYYDLLREIFNYRTQIDANRI